MKASSSRWGETEIEFGLLAALRPREFAAESRALIIRSCLSGEPG